MTSNYELYMLPEQWGQSERTPGKWFRSCPHQGSNWLDVLNRTFLKGCGTLRTRIWHSVPNFGTFRGVNCLVRDESECSFFFLHILRLYAAFWVMTDLVNVL